MKETAEGEGGRNFRGKKKGGKLFFFFHGLCGGKGGHFHKGIMGNLRICMWLYAYVVHEITCGKKMKQLPPTLKFNFFQI